MDTGLYVADLEDGPDLVLKHSMPYYVNLLVAVPKLSDRPLCLDNNGLLLPLTDFGPF